MYVFFSSEVYKEVHFVLNNFLYNKSQMIFRPVQILSVVVCCEKEIDICKQYAANKKISCISDGTHFHDHFHKQQVSRAERQKHKDICLSRAAVWRVLCIERKCVGERGL